MAVAEVAEVAEVAGVMQQQPEYGGQLGQLVYHNDGSYIEYSYEDGTKTAGEASVQVVKLSTTFRGTQGLEH